MPNRVQYLKEHVAYVRIPEILGAVGKDWDSSTDSVEVHTLSVRKVLQELEAIIAKREENMQLMRKAFGLLFDVKQREGL